MKSHMSFVIKFIPQRAQRKTQGTQIEKQYE